jgi:hypothetical protein
MVEKARRFIFLDCFGLQDVIRINRNRDNGKQFELVIKEDGKEQTHLFQTCSMKQGENWISCIERAKSNLCGEKKSNDVEETKVNEFVMLWPLKANNLTNDLSIGSNDKSQDFSSLAVINKSADTRTLSSTINLSTIDSEIRPRSSSGTMTRRKVTYDAADDKTKKMNEKEGARASQRNIFTKLKRSLSGKFSEEVPSLGKDMTMQRFSMLREKILEFVKEKMNGSVDLFLVSQILTRNSSDDDLFTFLNTSFEVIIVDVEKGYTQLEKGISSLCLLIQKYYSDFLSLCMIPFASENGLSYFGLTSNSYENIGSHCVNYSDELLSNVRKKCIEFGWKVLKVESMKLDSKLATPGMPHASEIDVIPWLSDSFEKYISAIYSIRTHSTAVQNMFLTHLIGLLCGKYSPSPLGMIQKPVNPHTWKALFSILSKKVTASVLKKEILRSLTLTLMSSWENVSLLLQHDSSCWITWIVPIIFSTIEKNEMPETPSTEKRNSLFFKSSASMKESASSLAQVLLVSILMQLYTSSKKFEGIFRNALNLVMRYGISKNQKFESLNICSNILSNFIKRVNSKQMNQYFKSECPIITGNFLSLLSNLKEYLLMTQSWGNDDHNEVKEEYFTGNTCCKTILRHGSHNHRTMNSLSMIDSISKATASVSLTVQNSSFFEFGIHMHEEYKYQESTLIRETRKLVRNVRTELGHGFNKLPDSSSEDDLLVILEFEQIFFDQIQTIFEIIEDNRSKIDLHVLPLFIQELVHSGAGFKNFVKHTQNILLENAFPYQEHFAKEIDRSRKFISIQGKLIAVENICTEISPELQIEDYNKTCKSVFTGRNAIDTILKLEIVEDEDSAHRICNFLLLTEEIRCISHPYHILHKDKDVYYKLKIHDGSTLSRKSLFPQFSKSISRQRNPAPRKSMFS